MRREAAASTMLTIRCGRAEALTPMTLRKQARTATSIPRPATLIPERAVTGDDIRLRPNINRKAAPRSAAPVIM